MTAARLRAPIAMIAALFLLVLTAFVAVPTATATGSHGGAGKVCPSDGGWRKTDGLTGTSYTVQATDGHLIAEVCVKAATEVHREIVDPPAASYVITSPAANGNGKAQDISHVSVREIPDSGGWFYPAPTCEGHLTVTYPDGVQHNNHVNIRVTNGATGEERTFNFHSATDYVGEVTFDVTTHVNWPGWTSYSYEWVQVAETNYHWEGVVTCDGDEIPEEEPPVETPEVEPTPSPTPSSEPSEAPEAPTEDAVGSLEGSVAVGECVADAPWIAYDVVLSGAEGDLTEQNASLVLTDGTNTETIELGALDEDGTLSGRALWPGASVAEDGVTPTGWPGWEQAEDGTWVETDENFAWTRGDLTATIVVNPDIEVELAYPVATPNCAAAPPSVDLVDDDTVTVTTDDVEAVADVEAAQPAPTQDDAAVETGAETLPQTGSTLLPLVLGALALVAAGGTAIYLVRRRA
jgi:LPXTG-motif cell wall-anchored protein